MITLTDIQADNDFQFFEIPISETVLNNRRPDPNCDYFFSEVFCSKCKSGYILVPTNIGGYCYDEGSDLADHFRGG